MRSSPQELQPAQFIRSSTSDDGPVELLRGIVETVRRQIYWIALWVVACTALAGIYASMLSPVFSSEGMMLLEPRRALAQTGGPAPTTLDMSRTDSELQILRSERLLYQVFDNLDLASHPELATPNSLPGNEENARKVAFARFMQRLDARRVGQSYVVDVSYTSSDPTLPARVVNSAISAYLLQAINFKLDAARTNAEIVQGRLDTLAEQAKSAAAAMKLGTLPDIPTPDADARVIGAALQPLGPEGPKRGLITLLGGIFGLLSAVFLGTMASILDRRVHTPDQLARETGLRCLAKFPEKRKAGRPAGFELDDSSSSLAIRDFRTEVKLACEREHGVGNHVIAFLACEPDIDTGRLCMAIARRSTLAGRPMRVVDTDVQKKAGTGAVEASAPGASAFSDLMASTAGAETIAYTDAGGVLVLPARSKQSSPGGWVDLHDRKAADIISSARAQSDVLMNLPSIASAADAQILAAHADAVVLALRPGQTTVDKVKEAQRLLDGAGAHVIGGIFLTPAKLDKA